MDLYEQQLQLEQEYSTESLALGQKAIIDAYAQGRATDVGAGKYLLAKAFTVSLEAYQAGKKSYRSKYKALLDVIPDDIVIMAALREVLSACANPEPKNIQSITRTLGKAYESEAMLVSLTKLSPEYTQRTIEYLDSTATKSVSHRYRTFKTASKALSLDWVQWSTAERVAVVKRVLTIIYDATGLFKWEYDGKQYNIKPTEELAKHFADMIDSAKASVKYPPMLVPPLDWTSFDNGGYLTEWFRIQSPMCSLPFLQHKDRRWVVDNLSDERTAPLRNAMNKAQQVPYRVNKRALEVLRKAVVMRSGIMGLPRQLPTPKPDFPFNDEWVKSDATPQDLDLFKLWKQQMGLWYTNETKRKGRVIGILSKLKELVRYQDTPSLYFPTFIDWRGRLYFRGSLSPQSSDSVKGVLEFANGKRLGTDGLFWLKVHVANSCGYDKHSPEIKAKWCDENWDMVQDFINNPLEVDAPAPDTAFTLLQAGLALQDALELPNPQDYVSHVPIAMDATCSGLQHFSALTRDTVGAEYTNLIDNGLDQKSDIYVAVAERATRDIDDYVDDAVLKHYWSDKEITRKFAKTPVMTKVYNSTLLSTVDNLCVNMSDAGFEVIRDKDTKRVVYSLHGLALPVAKALRGSVDKLVPKSDEMMQYLKSLTRAYKSEPIRWYTPVGMPVINWSSKQDTTRIKIHSMGIEKVTYRSATDEYNQVTATNGIVPNFIHSNDASHLCLTINNFHDDILPIHDSFATHACSVGAMHESLRSTFINMYKEFSLKDMLLFNNIDLEVNPIPITGNLDLDVIHDARFMFG